MIDQSRLRLSAQRALLGRIHPEMRLVKIKSAGSGIFLSVLLDHQPSDRLRNDISEATTEIIADFPEASNIEERFEITHHPLPAENVVAEGWLYRRAE